jgi:hypothetical protein
MSDSSLDNLAMGSSLSGASSPLSLSSGGGSSSLFSGSGPSGSQLLGAGALGIGAVGIGSLLAQGPGNLPSQYGQLEQNAPWLQAAGQQEFGQGQSMVTSGQQALTMAQNGQLTAPQQAQLNQYSTGLTNQSRQMFANMGQNPDQSTAFLTQTANNDAQVNAMAQQEIQSTIQLGLGEVSGGSSLMSGGLGYESAANQALIAAGQAQIQLDQQYSSGLSSAFGAIGSLFGAVVGGPAGAAVGGSLGKVVGTAASS